MDIMIAMQLVYKVFLSFFLLCAFHIVFTPKTIMLSLASFLQKKT